MADHVVVAAALVARGRVLLCHRTPERAWFPDVWDFPGGHVEAEEPPRAALARELHEELGVCARLLQPEPIIAKVTQELDLTVWLCAAWEGVATNRQLQEHDQIAWFTWADLADLPMADDAYLPALRRILDPAHRR